MGSAQPFGEILSRVRREQGFASAHAFYRGVRGRKALGLAYVNYLNLEQGKSLPQPERLKRLFDALGLSEDSPHAKELARSYLKCLLGSDYLLRFLEAPAPDAGALPSVSLAEEAARQSIRQRIVRLTLEQYALLNRSEAALLCYHALVNTPGWLEHAELARMTGLGLPGVKGALSELKAAGLVELSAGKSRCPLNLKHVALPSSLAPATKTFDSLRRYGLLKKRGTAKHIEGVVVRMAHAQLGRYVQHLSDAVKLAGVYGNAEKAQDTDVYFVEGGVYRIFD